MSATLAALIGVVAPQWSVTVFERRDRVAGESSGRVEQRGHRARRALRAQLHARRPGRPRRPLEGRRRSTSSSRSRASSGRTWSRGGMTGSPRSFITPVPHLSFVTGEDGRRYMRARHAALAAQPLFEGLEYTEDAAQLAEWLPLMMAGRDPGQVVAATRSAAGTDVNFGALTRLLLDVADGTRRDVHFNQRVRDLGRGPDGRWMVTVRDARHRRAPHGPRPVRLRRRRRRRAAAAAEGRHPRDPRLRRLPGQRQFLRTTSPELVAQHQAKVYGQAAVGAPPMSVPHLDLAADRRRPLAAVRPLRRLLAEVPQGRVDVRPAAQRPPDNLGSMLGRGTDRARAHPVPDRRARCSPAPPGTRR